MSVKPAAPSREESSSTGQNHARATLCSKGRDVAAGKESGDKPPARDEHSAKFVKHTDEISRGEMDERVPGEYPGDRVVRSGELIH